MKRINNNFFAKFIDKYIQLKKGLQLLFNRIYIYLRISALIIQIEKFSSDNL